jgi:tRNA(Met) C34 N-acetyltransferase TmcA
MDKKQANLAFHHSERLKSNLFLVSGALDRLTTLEGERLEGGKEVSKGVSDALRAELNMARRFMEPAETDAIEKELFEVEAEIEIHDYAKAREHLGQTFSHVTTLSNKYIKILMDEDLI